MPLITKFTADDCDIAANYLTALIEESTASHGDMKDWALLFAARRVVWEMRDKKRNEEWLNEEWMGA